MGEEIMTDQFLMWFNIVFFVLNAGMYAWKTNKVRVMNGVASLISLGCAFFFLSRL